MNLSLAIHIIGIVAWVGGLLILTRVMTIFSQPLSDREAILQICKRLFWGWCVGGLAVATVTGTIQILIRGIGFYMAQGWFHAKLTFVIALLVATFGVGLQMKRATSGATLKRGTVMAFHGVAGASMIAITLLTFLGR